MTDNPTLLFTTIIVGVVGQQILTWLERHDKRTAYKIVRPMIFAYWIILGVVIMTGGIILLSPGSILPAISSVAFGLGLAFSGIGQSLERDRLRNIGLGVLSIGPIVSGVNFIQSGNALEGMILLALGLGILISTLRGWLGGIGQTVIGAVILGSSAMLLIGTLVTATRQVDWVTVVIGAAMLAMGAWVIINGAITIMGTIKQSKVALPSG